MNLFPWAAQPPSEKTINPSHLQDELLRFEGRFAASIGFATQSLLQSQDPAVRSKAVEIHLTYLSSAFDIALAQAPEVSLLDMVVLVELGRHALETHWIPTLFGENGEALRRSFERSSGELWDLARTVLTSEQSKALGDLITRWKIDHPGQFNVAAVRFSELAQAIGAQSAGSETEPGGLLSGVRKAAQSADAAVLLGERALYAAQRAPFLLRLHMRLGAAEMLQTSEVFANRILLKVFLLGSGLIFIAAAAFYAVRPH